MIHTAYVGIGSNLNDPCANVKQAIQSLTTLPNTTICRVSKLYLTKPLGYTLQPDFINAVVKLQTQIEPAKLLQQLQALEISMGRTKNFLNGPRIIDLDLLLYDTLEMHTEELTLPHPRMFMRNFVLIPLLEIAPQLKKIYNIDIIIVQDEVLCLEN